MAQPKIIIIKKPGETISQRQMKRYEKVARSFDKKPKVRKPSIFERARRAKEKRELKRELEERFMKKPKKSAKRKRRENAFIGAFKDATRSRRHKYAKGNRKRRKKANSLSLGGYNF